MSKYVAKYREHSLFAQISAVEQITSENFSEIAPIIMSLDRVPNRLPYILMNYFALSKDLRALHVLLKTRISYKWDQMMVTSVLINILNHEFSIYQKKTVLSYLANNHDYELHKNFVDVVYQILKSNVVTDLECECLYALTAMVLSGTAEIEALITYLYTCKWENNSRLQCCIATCVNRLTMKQENLKHLIYLVPTLVKMNQQNSHHLFLSNLLLTLRILIQVEPKIGYKLEQTIIGHANSKVLTVAIDATKVTVDQDPPILEALRKCTDLIHKLIEQNDRNLALVVLELLKKLIAKKYYELDDSLIDQAMDWANRCYRILKTSNRPLVMSIYLMIAKLKKNWEFYNDVEIDPIDLCLFAKELTRDEYGDEVINKVYKKFLDFDIWNIFGHFLRLVCDHICCNTVDATLHEILASLMERYEKKYDELSEENKTLFEYINAYLKRSLIDPQRISVMTTENCGSFLKWYALSQICKKNLPLCSSCTAPAGNRYIPQQFNDIDLANPTSVAKFLFRNIEDFAGL